MRRREIPPQSTNRLVTLASKRRGDVKEVQKQGISGPTKRPLEKFKHQKGHVYTRNFKIKKKRKGIFNLAEMTRHKGTRS